MSLPTLPDDVVLPPYGALPRFTQSVNGVDWHVVGPADAVRPGEMVHVARADGTKSWVQVGQLVGERLVRHRAETVRYVAAPVDRFHSPENCALCGGEFFVGEDRARCTCDCHGKGLIERVFDSSPLSTHTYEGRVLTALRELAKIPDARRREDTLIFVDLAIRALTGADYDEYAAHLERRARARRPRILPPAKGPTP